MGILIRLLPFGVFSALMRLVTPIAGLIGAFELGPDLNSVVQVE